ncbi:TonB-dependent receptor [Caulobacter flavus]|uniref:TonB-dependent receptor n=1 Tax=Caulobacter flavus TaxID=1679497 RepID=UPI0011AF0DFD|nr:TonB-dependent receptor [Caulobacter flavus]
MRNTSSRFRLLSGLAAWVLLAPATIIAAPAVQAAEAQVIDFDIPAGTLDAALIAFGKQSGRPVAYSQDVVAGLRSGGLKARLTPEAAIAKLLANVPVELRHTGGGAMVLKRFAIPVIYSSPLEDPISPLLEPVAPAPTEVAEVVVTGSLIRGQSVGASPVVTMSRDDLDRSGRATIADMLTELPQAFGGANSGDTSLTNSDTTGGNASVATGVNLRGLGASATLVLVNGRRMAGSGLKGDFADVSGLPTAAVDRVEVLLDGASAIYGSDAVGGVVNVILRKDFSGAETRARVGVAEGGGALERLAAQTLGATWSGGHVLASYEHYHRDSLASAERDFAATADLRSLGGTDRRLFYSRPGNVLVFNSASAAYVPTWAIPPGQSGVGLTASSFQAGVVNLENQRDQTDILPEQRRDTVYLAISQALAPNFEVSADARIGRRSYAYALPGSVANLTVTSANPYFVSPNGAASNVIAYSFTDELGPLRSRGKSDSLALSVGADIDIGRTWRASFYGAYAEEVSRRANTNRLNTRFLSEALGSIADDPATSYSAARDGYFNPYGDGAANSQAVLDFISGGYIRTRYASQIKTVNAQADGVVMALPGGPMKLAVGAQVRTEDFQTRTISMTSRATPTKTITGPFRRTVAAGFAELRAPLVGPDNALPGVRRLELSLAARVERYDDVGETRNPKIGVVWAPSGAVIFRATYGTSFRAPSLPEVFEPQDAGAAFLQSGSTTKLVLLRYGGNPNLKPEEAKSWTAGVDYASKRWPGLKLSLTWFDTDFTDKIGTPVYDDIYNVLGNAAYAPFVQTLDPNNAADQAKLSALLATTTSAGLYPTNAYTAIVDGRNVNTGGLRIQGLDLSARHRLEALGGRVDLSADLTYLIDYERQLTPTTKWVSYLDQAGQPVDLRARTSATWSRGPWAASAAVNYVDDYATAQGVAIDSWTTLDAQLAWRPERDGLLGGLAMALSVQNLLGADPPFYDSPQGVGYDPANADPLGRFVALQLTKRW